MKIIMGTTRKLETAKFQLTRYFKIISNSIITTTNIELVI